jgi:hypothetical protein
LVLLHLTTGQVSALTPAVSVGLPAPAPAAGACAYAGYASIGGVAVVTQGDGSSVLLVSDPAQHKIQRIMATGACLSTRGHAWQRAQA